MNEVIPKPLRCRKCRSTELVLHEARYEHAEFDGGLFVNEYGQLAAHGDGYFFTGDGIEKMTKIECRSCGHWWRPRRSFAGGGR